MAIYHMSVKAVSRSAGRSSTGAAAYRSGEKIMDERTGEIHDYTRKGGVEFSEIVMPSGATWEPSRSELWNAAELAEKRKDACVAREHEIALPKELSAEQRTELAQQYAQDLADRHGCAVDVAIHSPHKDKGGDANDNYHAHLLCTTREVDGQGLGQKCQREKAGQNRAADLELERSTWAGLQNTALEKTGHSERVDHRSLEAQGIDREPTAHKGPAVTEMERRGIQTEVSKRLEAARDAGEFERNLGRAIDSAIQIQTTSLASALAEKAAITTQRKLDHDLDHKRRAPPSRLADMPRLSGGHHASDIPRAHDVLRQAAHGDVGIGTTKPDLPGVQQSQSAGGVRPESRYSPENMAKREAEQSAKVAAIEKQVNASDLTPEQRAVVLARVRENAAKPTPSNQPREAGKAASPPQAGAVEPVLPEKPKEVPEIAPEAPLPDALDVSFADARLTQAEHELVHRAVDAAKSGDEAEQKRVNAELSQASTDITRSLQGPWQPLSSGEIEQIAKNQMNAEHKAKGWSEPWALNGENNYKRLEQSALQAVNHHRSAPKPLYFGKKEYEEKDDALLKNYESWKAAAPDADKEMQARVARMVPEAEKRHADHETRRQEILGRREALRSIETQLETAMEYVKDKQLVGQVRAAEGALSKDPQDSAALERLAKCQVALELRHGAAKEKTKPPTYPSERETEAKGPARQREAILAKELERTNKRTDTELCISLERKKEMESVRQQERTKSRERTMGR